MAYTQLFRLLLLYFLPTDIEGNAPPGTFRTECRDRYFWLTVKSTFVGEMFGFDVEDHDGVHTVTEDGGAECGFTVVFDTPGNLVFRASFFACHVDNEDDRVFRLLLWFVNVDRQGQETSYPFSMACRPEESWRPREIVCEENYMEVSVKKDTPVPSYQGLGKADWAAVFPIVQQSEMVEWRLVFHVSGRPELSLGVSEARALGYFLNSTSARVVLRCPYSTSLAETYQEMGVAVETVRVTVFYQQQWMLLMLDATLACPKDEATFDGARLTWVSPQLLSPLIRDPQRFFEGGARVGVEGQLLVNDIVRRRGYELVLRDRLFRVSVPLGAEGGYLTSRVIDNRYHSMYSLDLLFEHLWQDDRWEMTRHRCFRPLATPYVPLYPTLTNATDPSQNKFTQILGNFPPDVFLANLTFSGVVLSLRQSRDRGFEVAVTTLPNGTRAFRLVVPFRDPLVLQQYIGGGVRRYTLTLTFTLIIVPQNEVFYYPSTLVCDKKEVVLPHFEGQCLTAGIRILLYNGSLASQWEAYIGGRRLDWDQASGGRYRSAEVPLYGPGMMYEDLSLKGVSTKVEATLVDVGSQQVEETFVQRCTFPVRELLVCKSDGVMVVVADLSDSLPPLDPRRTTLLDRACQPSETDSSRALFRFGVDTCGTIRAQVEKDFLVYENEVLYRQKLSPSPDPKITRDSEYRLTIRCRYPANATRTLAAHRSSTPSPQVTRWGKSLLDSHHHFARGQRKPRSVLNTRARFATDRTFSSFHYAFPVRLAQRESLFLELGLVDPPPSLALLLLRLWDCWATPTPDAQDRLRKDLLSDGCLVSSDAYRVTFPPAPTRLDAGLLQRLEITALGPVEEHCTWGQAYFHCSVLLCNSTADVCSKTCTPGEKTSGHSSLPSPVPVALVSAGPVQRVRIAEKPLPARVLAVGVVAAAGGVLVLSLGGLALRRRSKRPALCPGSPSSCSQFPLQLPFPFSFMGFSSWICRRKMIMDTGLLLGVALLFAVLPLGANAALASPGAIETECRDRYFWISVDVLFAGSSYRFDVFNQSTVHQIVGAYASECGYTYSSFNVTDRVIFRASFFACHVENQQDKNFTLNYQFVTLSPSGTETKYPNSMNCLLTVPWEAREVMCEENYMEVSVRSNETVFSQGKPSTFWGITYVIVLQTAQPNWQVVFLKSGQDPVIMNATYARSKGYVIGPTINRAVFRAPFNKELSETTEINGIEVQYIQASIFYKQQWTLVLFNTTVACTTNPGSFENNNLIWTTPKLMAPLLQFPDLFVSHSLLMGVEGVLLDPAEMALRGYQLLVLDPLVEVEIPFDAEGGYREVHVIDNQYSERYSIDLYYEHLFSDGGDALTRHRLCRIVYTPYIPQTPFHINQTDERTRNFTVYLGNFNPDVDLITVAIKGVPLTMLQAPGAGVYITEVPHANGTHAYILETSFFNPLVIKTPVGRGVIQYLLTINYTLNIVPEDEPYYYLASVVAYIQNYPSQVTGLCNADSITFSMAHQEMGFLWQLTIEDEVLTADLAARRGYILTNNTDHLTLEVPLQAIGYTYQNVTLNQIVAAFTLTVRDSLTLEVVAVSMKRCPFATPELVVCTQDGVMTVVAQLTLTTPMVNPERTTLLDQACTPQEFNATTVLFSFGVTTCGTKAWIANNYLTYENEVVFHGQFLPGNAPIITRDSTYRLTVRCSYPVNGTGRLFIDRRFTVTSRSAGIGAMLKTTRARKRT
ncbi:uncharacterized protein LOC136768084 [Amia ocellicauda]|uniref:uncharacterized protein LOC136768084 n=1 Tax=Amia ocellicauda TaxID=2972642 RepID=UPI003464BF4E